MRNKYCLLRSLRNESDVEQHFIRPLLSDLGYNDTSIFTKKTIPAENIGKGKKRRSHIPDYAIKIGRYWVLVIEAKSPTEKVRDFVTEAQEYSSAINRSYIGVNPIKYCLVSNGKLTEVYPVDENKPILSLKFEDFALGNIKFEKLKDLLSLHSLRGDFTKVKDVFEFRKPSIGELKAIFQACHNLIRKKQSIGPKKAFYEFTKVLFVKMNEDKKIKAIKADRELEKKDFRFSLYYLDQAGKNAINSLFKDYRDDLERQVIRKEKKRIFSHTEEINLNPTTIREIVEMLQEIDLHSVEDDINGKVFETFLESAVRGKELGQFFTPREVVKFMTQLADMKIKKDKDSGDFIPEKILDPCCGTGGFLIFALSDLFKKLERLPISDKDKLKKIIKEQSLFGIDKSEDDIVPTTRMNMYLHGDGGSHIYMADALDKQLFIEDGLPAERVEELEELQTLFSNQKFDTILTNPPFSMKYEKKKDEEKKILEQYEIAFEGDDTTKMKSSLQSNVMFLERNYEFLKAGGKLLSVIDESVLNIKSNDDIRTFLRANFIIKAVISLPMNTFVNQDAGVKTSIIFLQKKNDADEQQPKVFMALVENVGHSSSGKPEPEKNQLVKLIDDYFEFEQTGLLPRNSIAFLTQLPENTSVRLDCEFYNPVHHKLIRDLNRLTKNTDYSVGLLPSVCVDGGVFLGKNPEEDKNEFEIGQDMEGCRYIKIEQMLDRYIDWDGCSNITGNFATNNPNKIIQFGDVLTPSRGDTIGKVDIVDRKNETAIAYSNIHILRADRNKVLPEYLVYYLRSDIGQMQINHYITGSLNPPQLIQEDLKRIVIAYPKSIKEQQKIIDKIKSEENKAIQLEKKSSEHLQNRNSIFQSEILE